VDPEAAAIVAREERRMARNPAHRSGRRTLERIARSYLIYEGPGAEPGAWDKFRVRNLALSVQRSGANPRLSPLGQLFAMIPDRAAPALLRAKQAPEERQYLKAMQRHSGLRAAVIRAGS
jgi:hypothetical protein